MAQAVTLDGIKTMLAAYVKDLETFLDNAEAAKTMGLDVCGTDEFKEANKRYLKLSGKESKDSSSGNKRMTKEVRDAVIQTVENYVHNGRKETWQIKDVIKTKYPDFEQTNSILAYLKTNPNSTLTYAANDPKKPKSGGKFQKKKKK